MPNANQSQLGKTCLVTGGTTGIGFVTACELARRGAVVVIVGRNRARGAAAVEQIRREADGAAVEFIEADLSALADVRRLAREFLERHDRLHVLINNAGALFALRRESVEGIEMTLALNHLSPFLLTQLLLPTIRASAPARIINVSSDAHEMAKAFAFDDPEARRASPRYGQSELASLAFALLAPRTHPGLLQYARSKLANLLFTYELARRLEGTGVTVNAMHPGLVATNFSSGNGSYGWFLRRWSSLFAKSPKEGAKTLIHLAISDDVRDISGKYFAKLRVLKSSPASHESESARRLWDMSEAMVDQRR